MDNLFDNFNLAGDEDEIDDGVINFGDIEDIISRMGLSDSLEVPPALSANVVFFADDEALTTRRSIFSLVALQHDGLLKMLWLLSMASIQQVDLSSDEERNSFFERNNVNTAVGQGQIPFVSSDNTLLSLLAWNGSATADANRTSAFMTAAGHDKETILDFVSSMCPTDDVSWVNNAFELWIFCDSEKIQSFISRCPRVYKAWCASHSSRGSALFGRITAICRMLGVEIPVPVRAFHILATNDLLPGYSVGFFPNSMNSLKIEGPLIASKIVSAARSISTTSKRLQEVSTILLNKLSEALTAIKEESVKNTAGDVILTIKSDAARATLADKLKKGRESLAESDGWVTLCQSLSSLDTTVISYRVEPLTDELARQVCSAMCSGTDVEVPDIPPDRGLETVSVCLASILKSWNPDRAKLLMVRAPYNTKCRTIMEKLWMKGNTEDLSKRIEEALVAVRGAEISVGDTAGTQSRLGGYLRG